MRSLPSLLRDRPPAVPRLDSPEEHDARQAKAGPLPWNPKWSDKSTAARQTERSPPGSPGRCLFLGLDMAGQTRAGRRQGGRRPSEPCFLNDLAGTEPGLAGGVGPKAPESTCPSRQPLDPGQPWPGPGLKDDAVAGTVTAPAPASLRGDATLEDLGTPSLRFSPTREEGPTKDHLVTELPPRARQQGPHARPGSLTKPLTASGCRNAASTRDSREAPCQGPGPQAK